MLPPMQKLPGNYQLTKYGYDYKQTKQFKPISDFYTGSIHYSSDGQMSVIVRFAKSPEEFSEIVAYSGSYQVQGDQIVHQVKTSVRPDYEGQTLIRTYRIENDELITEFENTDEFIKFAIWKRIQ